MDRVILDSRAFKALAAQTRIDIIKELHSRPHTIAELAHTLGFAPPTIKEHITSLEEADLVSKQDDGHKWKYYRLTRKGNAILESRDHEFTLLFITLIASVIGASYAIINAVTSAGHMISQPAMASSEAMLKTTAPVSLSTLPLDATGSGWIIIGVLFMIIAACSVISLRFTTLK